VKHVFVVRSRYGQRLVRIRTLGGSVPAGPFIDTSGTGSPRWRRS